MRYMLKWAFGEKWAIRDCPVSNVEGNGAGRKVFPSWEESCRSWGTLNLVPPYRVDPLPCISSRNPHTSLVGERLSPIAQRGKLERWIASAASPSACVIACSLGSTALLS